MASLNTLRTKGGVIVSIVIGVALLAFLVGDLFSSGSSMFSSRKMKVGEIEGTSIGYVEYTDLVNRYETIVRALSQNESLDAEGYNMAREMAWESMINELAFQPGYEKLGLITSAAEQIDMINGAYASPVVQNSFVNPQTGLYDPSFLQSFVARAQTDPTTHVLWDYMKQQMVLDRVSSKFMSLVYNSMFVTDLEVEAEIDPSKELYDVRIVSKPYFSVADSTVNVTAAEISEYYKANKKNFKQEASRDVEYVIFDLVPSEADYLDAAKYIAQIAEEFEASEAPMQYALLNSQVRPEDKYLSINDIEPAIATAVFGKPEAVYGPMLNHDTYTIARQADVKMIPDSVGARRIVLSPVDKNLADSIVDAVRGGADFAELASKYSIDQQTAAAGGDLGRFDPTLLPTEFVDPIVNARVNDVFAVNSSYIFVMQLTYKSTPTMKAQIATIKYDVEPSSTTQTSIYNDVSKFYANASGSYDNFKKAANDAVVSKRVARISSSDRNVQGLNDSRELVRWAFNSKKGEVSNIMQIDGDYVIAVQTGVREAGIASEAEAADQIRPVLARRKKADILAAEVQGMTFEQAAAKFEDDPIAVSAVTFSMPYLDGIGREPKLTGAITAGKMLKPVAGNQGVYVYEITGKSPNDAVASATDQRIRLESMGGYMLQERMTQAMLDEVEVIDSRVKFF